MKRVEYAHDLIVSPAENELFGTVAAPPSKSATHRAFILAALSHGEVTIKNVCRCTDTDATRECLTRLGARFSDIKSGVRISPIIRSAGNITRFPASKPIELDCGASGSTLRFILPLVCALGVGAEFTGDRRLFQRPSEALIDALCGIGAKISETERGLSVAPSRLTKAKVDIRADVSSQFISGLLMALPVAFTTPCEINLLGEPVSRDYITLTADLLNEFGVRVACGESSYTLCAPGGFRRTEPIVIEGDFSSAAVLLAAGALSSNDGVTVTGLNINSAQPDRAILNILERMGARVIINETSGDITVRRPESGELKPLMDISVRDCPDLAAVLVPLMARANGVSRMVSAGALRAKECDRLDALAQMLTGLSITAIEGPDSLAITGKPQKRNAFAGGTNNVAFTRLDHRMAFAATLLGISSDMGLIAYGGDCIQKSYPDFFEALNSLAPGGRNVVEIRR